MKVGRNDPCPCGSGKKYKFCCLNPIKAYLIKNNRTGRVINLGQIASFSNLLLHYGDLKKVKKNVKNFKSYIYVDLPLLLPLDDDQYEVCLENEKYKVSHTTSTKGDEIFSNFDTSKLPYFSTIQIFCNKAIIDDRSLPEEKLNSYKIIINVLYKILSFIPEEIDIGIKIGDEPDLGYTIFTQEIDKPFIENIVLTTEIPFSGTLKFYPPSIKNKIDQEKLKKYLSEKIKINSFIEKKSFDYQKFNFQDKVFYSTHDFMFYSRQHPQVFNELYEELIRDLYLVILKIIFSTAEGEVYNFDGKTDVKIQNPENKYVFNVLEFKWWKGPDSFKEQFHQLIRKHATGQESQYYMIILSKNKNVNSICNQLSNLLSEEEEYVENSFEKLTLDGSKENIFTSKIVNRNEEYVRINIFVFDLYYQKS